MKKVLSTLLLLVVVVSAVFSEGQLETTQKQYIAIGTAASWWSVLPNGYCHGKYNYRQCCKR